MLHLRRDNMISLVAESEESALQRKVVGFAPAARENDLVNLATEQPRDLTARRFKSRFCRGSCPMATRWIAVVFFQKRSHRSNHPWVDRRAGIVVQVDVALCHGPITGKPRGGGTSPTERWIRMLEPDISIASASAAPVRSSLTGSSVALRSDTKPTTAAWI
jgi:hypothetical protein